LNKTVIALATACLLGAGAWYALLVRGSGSSTVYSDTNIDIGAVAAPATACPDLVGHARLVCLADLVKSGLSPDLLARFQLPYTVACAKRWSNFPPAGYQDRVGPTLADFTADQRSLLKAMLIEATGTAPNEGFDELVQVLNADDYLKANTSDNAHFSSGNYHVALLGTPAATGTWQFYFGGHHFALSNTYTDGMLVGATPSFRGVEPFTTFSQNGRDNAPMVQEQAAFAAALTALSPEDSAKAKLAETYTDIVAGPQRDDAIPTANEGLRIGDLSPNEQALIAAAIETYVRDIAQTDGDTIMAKYQAELPDTYLAFSGTSKLDAENDYVRVDGPSVWIEISMQPGRSLPGIHPHSVWRDKGADYGGNK
jgi:hypothetical protein